MNICGAHVRYSCGQDNPSTSPSSPSSKVAAGKEWTNKIIREENKQGAKIWTNQGRTLAGVVRRGLSEEVTFVLTGIFAVSTFAVNIFATQLIGH